MILLKSISILAIVILLAACASTQGPVVIRDSVEQTQTTTQSTQAADLEPVKKPTPVAQDAPRLTLPVLEKRIANANQYYQQGRYEDAINEAERGLRVDRKESRLYLVLARAYEGQGNKDQARYFARQGLRYTEKGGPTQRALSSIVWQ